jgi:hypothetical protein
MKKYLNAAVFVILSYAGSFLFFKVTEIVSGKTIPEEIILWGALGLLAGASACIFEEIDNE